MKCIRCGVDSKYKDRSNRICPGCRKPFAFEPQQGDKLTDAAFQNAIEAVSARGQVRWGVEHLYYEVARRMRPTVVAMVVASVILSVAGLAMLLNKAFFGAAVAIALAAVFGFLAWRRKTSPFRRLELPEFDKLWRAWQDAHGQPKGLIMRAQARGAPAPPRQLEADITDYSFDRAVICDRARSADLLLANNFHFENNCAVLSLDGYPEGLFETVRRMLKRNPRLRVFALHDATPRGCGMAHRLANEHEWFAGTAKITDVGLRPVQAVGFRGQYLSVTAQTAGGNGISKAEALWLSQYGLEVAAIRPEQVLKRLFQAMHRGEQEDFDEDSFRYDAGDVDAESDGFG